MAHRFIVAETAADAVGRPARRSGATASPSSLDLLGEATVTGERGRPLRRPRRRRRRSTIAAAAPRWPPRPRLEHDFAGPIPRANLSVKVSALTPLLRPDAPERGKRDAAARLRRAAALGHATAAPTCTSTWSRSTRATRCSSSCSSCSPSPSSRDGPVGRASCSRPTCATRRSRLRRRARLGARRRRARSR